MSGKALKYLLIIAFLSGCTFVSEEDWKLANDRDGDGFLAQENGGDDCDDSRPEVYPGAEERCDGMDNDCDSLLDALDPDVLEALSLHPDVDEDSFGDSGETLRSCEPVEGYLEDASDCDDSDPGVHPGAKELWYDGIDQDCDTNDCDQDADTFCAADYAFAIPEGFLPGDCDDLSATIFPGAKELWYDGADQDCDGNDCDQDGDGFLAASSGACVSGDDCDDLDLEVHPGASERWYDGTDQDCDGNDCDQDLDGFDVVESGACSGGEDCDDEDFEIKPGATELWYDGIDQDCDENDCDQDLDGYDVVLSGACSGGLDCDDLDSSISPGGIEDWIDAVDEDCDGNLCDRDEDRYCASSYTLPLPAGYGGGDCEDLQDDVNPGATEIEDDSFDQNCDGYELCPDDLDQDGWLEAGGAAHLSLSLSCDATGDGERSDPGGDCDDSNESVHPGATEQADDGVDQDCDSMELCPDDLDDDSFVALGAPLHESSSLDCLGPGDGRASEAATDCDDSRSFVYPGAEELPATGIDENCDDLELCYQDIDGDSHASESGGLRSSSSLSCTGAGDADASAPRDDCDDTESAVHPGATELVDDGRDQDCDALERCPDDSDNDGYVAVGAPSHLSESLDCEASTDGRLSDPATDCDDGDAAIHPSAAELLDDGRDQDCDGFELCYQDIDGDSYLSDSPSTLPSDDLDCLDPTEGGASTPWGDCDDTRSDVNPAALELPGDEFDQDCDGGELCFLDEDNDDHRPDDSSTISSLDLDCVDSQEARAEDPAGDCDDLNAAVHPSAPELAGDATDSDCDGLEQCLYDADDDGYLVDSPDTILSTDIGCGGATEALLDEPRRDCDDTDSTVYPGATESVGDERDSDCDGGELCYLDSDDDSYRPDLTASMSSLDLDCVDAGEARDDEPSGDCDDSNASIHPGAVELAGDQTDSDCDAFELCLHDLDDDSFLSDAPGTILSSDLACAGTSEALLDAPRGDCDDTDSTVYPGATESVGDERDSDCDGGELCFLDTDDDGYRPDSTSFTSSSDLDCADAGEARDDEPSGDCDDSNASIHPGAVELAGDERDSDCDGAELCLYDADDDGFLSDSPGTIPSTDLSCSGANEALLGDPGGDCDDSRSLVRPGATETIGDEVDVDCDGTELCFLDADDDGYRPDTVSTRSSSDTDCAGAGEATSLEPTGDCDDSNALFHPGATEGAGDGLDANCDSAELCYADADGDSHRASSGSTVDSTDLDCDDPGEAWSSEPDDDCDDSNSSVHPGVDEHCDGVDEDCDGTTDEDPVDATTWYLDRDEDDYGHSSASVDACAMPDGYSAWSTDCDDDDPSVNPGVEIDDLSLPLLDDDCDGFYDEDALEYGAIVLAEISRDPLLPDPQEGVWFEVYNTGDFDINLSNWEIQVCDTLAFTEPSLPAWDDSCVLRSVAISPDAELVVSPGSFVVLCQDSWSFDDPALCAYDFGAAWSGESPSGTPYSEPSLRVRPANGIVALSLEGGTVDEVGWYELDEWDRWPRQTGRSMCLLPGFESAGENDLRENWALPVSSVWSSWYEANLGSPGAANDDCIP